MRAPASLVLALFLCSTAALVTRAGAVPLALSESDFTWSASDGNVRFTLALHLEDMSYPLPGIGQIRLTITGHVEQPNYRHRYLSAVGMEMYGDVYDARAHAAVRAALGESVFSDPRMSGSTFSPGLTGSDDPITYAWIDFDTGVPNRQLDWRTTATLLVYDVNVPPSSVLFAGHYRVTCLPERRRRCDGDLGAFANIFNVELTLASDPARPGFAFRVAMIPEPGTGLLVIAGLLGLAGRRRVSAS